MTVDDLRGKVIKGLKCLAGMYEMKSDPCMDCGYQECQAYAICIRKIARDALSLMKAQEAKQMIAIAESDVNISVGRCPSCDETIVNNSEHPTRFCKYCGQAVKWE